MLGTQTQGGRMVGADESTELWRGPTMVNYNETCQVLCWLEYCLLYDSKLGLPTMCLIIMVKYVLWHWTLLWGFEKQRHPLPIVYYLHIKKCFLHNQSSMHYYNYIHIKHAKGYVNKLQQVTRVQWQSCSNVVDYHIRYKLKEIWFTFVIRVFFTKEF